MSRGVRLLTASLLGSGARVVESKRSKPHLGPLGRCPGKPTLVITVVDDSGSVTAPGGADPISNRYSEMRLALKTVGEACLCRKELAAVVHFDTPAGDVAPQRLNRAGRRALTAELAVPALGRGTSDLGPALAVVEKYLEAHDEHEAVVLIASDFELTDDDLTDVVERLRRLDAEVHACVLGSRQSPSWLDEVADVVMRVSPYDPPGAVARAVLGSMATFRRRGRERSSSIPQRRLPRPSRRRDGSP